MKKNKEQLEKLVKEAKDEIDQEIWDSCRSGLKTLMKKAEHQNRNLEKYKIKVQNDPIAAAEEYRNTLFRGGD